MGSVLIIPNSNFGDNAVFENGVKIRTKNNYAFNLWFYHKADTSMAGTKIDVQSNILTKFPEPDGNMYLDAFAYRSSADDNLIEAEIFFKGVYSTNNMFRNNSGLKNLKVSGSSNRISQFAGDCTSLENVELDMTISGEMFSMFNNCQKIKVIDFSDCLFYDVTDMSSCFKGCSSLDTVIFGTINCGNVSTFSEIFEGCPIKHIKGTLLNIGKHDSCTFFSVGTANNLDVESLRVIINGLYDNSKGSTTKKLYLTAFNKSLLDSKDLEVISLKKWEIAMI